MLFTQRTLPLLSAFIIGLIKIAHANTVIHDDSFIPDITFSVTQEERKQSCVSPKKILLVNGTSPGPELRFTKGKTVCIRVYNNVSNQNLPIVIILFTISSCPLLLQSSFYFFFGFSIGMSKNGIEIENRIEIFKQIF